jgi:hypothetical protein
VLAPSPQFLAPLEILKHMAWRAKQPHILGALMAQGFVMLVVQLNRTRLSASLADHPSRGDNRESK